MALDHLSSGDVASVLPLGEQLEQTPSTAYFKDDRLEVMRMILTAGKKIPAHAVSGPITVQCLEGEVEFRMGNIIKLVRGGDLLYLAGGVSHELTAIKSSALLVTIVLRG
jgi:quercetin dioxygenase-like cupin family protein